MVHHNDTDVVNFHALTPFPGADLYEHVEKYGTIPTDDFQDYSFEGIAFVPYTMAREQIEKLARRRSAASTAVRVTC